MSLLGKILRSSTAQNNIDVGKKSANDALKEFRPASVGVIPAESADFVSLEGQAYDGDMFHTEGMMQGGSDPSLLATQGNDHPSSPQQQQQLEREKVKGNNIQEEDKKGSGKSSGKGQFSWQDFTNPVLMSSKGEKERPTSRKLYMGSAGGSKNESANTTVDTDAHSDVRITYIGGIDRPGTSADRDDINLKKAVQRPTRSAGARPSPIRTSKFDYDNIRGAPYLQRMSSFGGFDSLPEYLAEQYHTTYGNDDQQRPPSRQGSAFPMNVDSSNSPNEQSQQQQQQQQSSPPQQQQQFGNFKDRFTADGINGAEQVYPVNLADLDSDDDILKMERSPARTAKGIRSAPGKKASAATYANMNTNGAAGEAERKNDERIRADLTKSNLNKNKAPGTTASAAAAAAAVGGKGTKGGKQEATTSVRAWSASKNGTRGVNNPVTDGFTELGIASAVGETPFKIHVNTGTGSKGKGKGKVKGKKKSLRKAEDAVGGGITSVSMPVPVVTVDAAAGGAAKKETTKQRPTLEITGLTSSSLNVNLLRSKKAVESEQLDELDDDFIVIDDDDDDEDEDENDEDEDEDGNDNDEEDDEGNKYSYKNEGNLAITELETNLDMDFLKLFAGN